MKIVHIYWSLTFGGIETMLVNIANAQVALGADVDVILINDYIDKALVNRFNPNVNIHIIGRKVGSKSIGFFFKLNRLLVAIKPDVIHLHDSRLYKLLLCKKFQKKACVTLHALPYGNISSDKFLYRLIPFLNFSAYGNVSYLDEIPKIFSISDSVKQCLSQNYNLKSSTILNGIDTSMFPIKSEIRDQKSTFRIISVGRLEHNIKGQDLLIKAASLLSKDIDFDVTFVGAGESLSFLQKLVDDLGLQKKIHFLGKKSQEFIAKELSHYDLFVQSSRHEGFGLTVAEAMAAKVPVLVSSGQGPAEVTCGTKYGWVFCNEDVVDLARKISFVYSNYSEAFKKAESALQYVRDTYDVSVTAKTYLNSYLL